MLIHAQHIAYPILHIHAAQPADFNMPTAAGADFVAGSACGVPKTACLTTFFAKTRAKTRKIGQH